MLSNRDHKEAELQDCLKENPILFGTEYREVIPKLALGSEYEMDFALRTWNGEIHVLEIEDLQVAIHENSQTIGSASSRGTAGSRLVPLDRKISDLRGEPACKFG